MKFMQKTATGMILLVFVMASLFSGCGGQTQNPKELEINATDLTVAIRELNLNVLDGTLNRSCGADKLNKLSPQKLPEENAEYSECLTIVNTLTVQDAIDYAQLGDNFNTQTIGNYAFIPGRSTIYPAGTLSDDSKKTLRLDTTFRELFTTD